MQVRQKKITFNLDTAQLGYYDEEMQFVVEPGQLDIMVGTSSEDLPFKETINLIGEKICIAGKRSYTCEVEEKIKYEKRPNKSGVTLGQLMMYMQTIRADKAE